MNEQQSAAEKVGKTGTNQSERFESRPESGGEHEEFGLGTPATRTFENAVALEKWTTIS